MPASARSCAKTRGCMEPLLCEEPGCICHRSAHGSTSWHGRPLDIPLGLQPPRWISPLGLEARAGLPAMPVSVRWISPLVLLVAPSTEPLSEPLSDPGWG